METENRSDNASRRIELFVAALLGIAAVLTAVSALRSALLGDEVVKGFTESSQHYGDAIAFEHAQTQQVLHDQNLFLRYVEARNADDADFAEELRSRHFTENLTAAVDWWESKPDTDEVLRTPFDEDSPYVDLHAGDIRSQNQAGDQAFERAERADNRGDLFDIAAAVLSVTLFTAGIASLLRSSSARRLTLAIAIAAMCVGIMFMIRGHFG